MSQEVIIDIAFRRRIPRNNDGLFSFSVPENLQGKLALGCVVSAPLQKQVFRAVVVRIRTDAPEYDVEPILDVCTPALLSSWQIDVAYRIAHEYFCPVAKIIPFFLPNAIFLGDGIPPQETFVTCGRRSPEKNIGKKMQEVLDILKTQGRQEKTHLRKKTKATSTVFNRLYEQEYIDYEQKNIYEKKNCTSPRDVPDISADFQKCLSQIHSKTPSVLMTLDIVQEEELFSFLCLRNVARETSTLLLVPDRASVAQVHQKYASVVGADNVVSYFSGQREGERKSVYWQISSGMPKVIIGTRSALFLPFCSLGNILLLQEHDQLYTSLQSPKYHTHFVARNISQIHSAPLIFSSPTPRLETYMETQSSPPILELLSPPPSSASLDFSSLRIVDMKQEKKEKNVSPLSRALLSQMQTARKHGKKIILFLNKRGMYRLLLCQDCGESTRCSHCQGSVVVHTKKGKTFLMCHYCGKVFHPPSRCHSCSSPHMEYIGSGTANIEGLLQKFFPEDEILRIDTDALSSARDFDICAEYISSGKGDIFIGTQMMTRGISFCNVGVIGILDADVGLHTPDFRATERAYQNSLRVLSLSRDSSITRIIQTKIPEYPLFSFLKTADTKGFLNHEYELRKPFGFPPLRRILKMIFQGKNREQVFAKARTAEALLRQSQKQHFSDVHVTITLAPDLMGKKQGKFSVHILVMAPNPEKILQTIPVSGCFLERDPVWSVV